MDSISKYLNNNPSFSAKFKVKMSDLKHTIKLVSMELSNFKSFSKFANINQDAHIVGPFTNFTGIVGPNGVGKSNIFDAVAFALNLSLAPGKVRHTRELAHRLNLVANGDNDSKNQDSQDSFEFFVKLNFLKINLETNKQETGSNNGPTALRRSLRPLNKVKAAWSHRLMTKPMMTMVRLWRARENRDL